MHALVSYMELLVWLLLTGHFAKGVGNVIDYNAGF